MIAFFIQINLENTQRKTMQPQKYLSLNNKKLSYSLIKLPKIKLRNHVATSPLLQKSGVHHKQDVDVIRMRERKTTKQYLQKNLWEKL